MTKKRSGKAQSSRFTLKPVSVFIGRIFLYFVLVTFILVVVYRFVNPPLTLLMVIRNIERKADGKTFKTEKEWVNLEDISDNFKRAAIAGEDQLFIHHLGFDIKAIRNAYRGNKGGGTMKGGSTISQQTAKNVFLWPGRSWVRKGFEAYFTLLIEMLWSKQRILEVYLNVIEMGDGIYGAEAASQSYYGKSCRKLTRAQAAMIVACFPNPLRWTPLHPTKFIRHRQYLIIRNIKNLGPLKFKS